MELGLDYSRGLPDLGGPVFALQQSTYRGADRPDIAEAYLATKQFDKGMVSVEEALNISRRSKESYYDAELYRLRGELLLNRKKRQSKDDFKKAESCFLRAVDIARRQKARSHELRATVALARLWQTMGKTETAHKTVSKIYRWFTEGFDTPDLQEAKKLLQR